MKLSKLYSNDGRFHSIEFNPGMNVVLGKVTRRYDRECDSHNLGKSTLVDLLDFMLLKDIDAKHIFRRFRDLFASHVFYLEIIIPEGVTAPIISRTKISILIFNWVIAF